MHLRTTNPIESTFSTVRHRTKVTKGAGSRAAGLADGVQADRVRARPLAGGQRTPARRARPRRGDLHQRQTRRATRGGGPARSSLKDLDPQVLTIVRPDLRPKTIQLYRYLLRRHLATASAFGTKTVAEIRDAHVRRWRKTLLESGVSPVTIAKAYRLLKAIMNTAVEDGLIRRNPCRIKGAGQEKSPERAVLTVRQVFALADSIAPRYRALILFAVFTSLRWGELAALRRKDIDLESAQSGLSGRLPRCLAAAITSGRRSPTRVSASSRSPT